MNNKLYLYSDVFCQDFIKDLLFDFEIFDLSEKFFSEVNFKNKSVLFVFKNKTKHTINQSFFSNNNVIVFFSKKENSLDENKYMQTKFLYGPIEVKKFLDAVKINFVSNNIVFKDIKIFGEKMINSNIEKSCFLTSLEKKILIEFVENKQIHRDYFLEKILKIKKNIETKTVESHLTRIRKKLLLIKSQIQISSKGEFFYLED